MRKKVPVHPNVIRLPTPIAMIILWTCIIQRIFIEQWFDPSFPEVVTKPQQAAIKLPPGYWNWSYWLAALSCRLCCTQQPYTGLELDLLYWVVTIGGLSGKWNQLLYKPASVYKFNANNIFQVVIHMPLPTLSHMCGKPPFPTLWVWSPLLFTLWVSCHSTPTYPVKL